METGNFFANSDGLTILRRVSPTGSIYEPPATVLHRTDHSDFWFKTQYLNLLESVLVGSLVDFIGRCGEKTCNLYKTEPFDLALRTSGDEWPPVGFTRIGNARLKNIFLSLHRICRSGGCTR